ncbi:MAG TPA: nitrate- and nitrite sensing domain-containing protein [Pseudonocardiaceae bacterium]
MRGGLAALGVGSASAVANVGASAAEARRGGRWRLRDWRLRTKLTAVLLVPLLLAGVLGVLRVTDLVRRAHDFDALARQIGFAQQLGLVVYNLQGERYRLATSLASGRAPEPVQLQAQFQRVDASVTRLRGAGQGAETFPAAAGEQWATAHRAGMSRLGGLAALRQAALRPPAGPGFANANNTIAGYSDLIGVLIGLDRQALVGVPDQLARQADGVKALVIAEEQASWEHAVLLVGLLSGILPVEQQATLRIADARFDAAADEFGQAMSLAQRQAHFGTRVVVDQKRLLGAALDRAARRAPLETVPDDWNSAGVGTVETIRQEQNILLNGLRTETAARGDRASREAFWDGAAVAVLLSLAVVLLVLVMRSLLQPLRALRTAAFDVADRRLPEAAEQLRTADGAPGQTAVEPVPVHSREEVGQVARAFDTVHAQAVRLAAEQAQLRCSLSDVFVRLSGRNEGLLDRQLRVLEQLRAAAPGAELGTTLLQLDRLATRMRRHSENLLLLAGGTVHRNAEGPVPVLDVLSDAVAEIEEYHRVTPHPTPSARLTAPVVTDVIHLTAELLDNAVGVAPQGTTVTLASSLTADNGLVVEITDLGPGLPANDLDAINAWLASTPAADPSFLGRAGLFVVRGLAARHGITVQLHPRAGGSGITATVSVPSALVMVDLRAAAGVPNTNAGVPNTNAGRPAGPDRAGEPAPAPWKGAEERLPLQVSVVDESTPADLFSPTSLGVSAPERPRTAQQEWLELFGNYESQPDGPTSSGGWESEAAATATDPLGTPVPGHLMPPATPASLDGAAPTGQPHEVREEIFEMVSAWFRERQSIEAGQSSGMEPPSASDWWSPFDEGWQAAQALDVPNDHEVTRSGLPKRQPRAHLVSSADGRVLPVPVGPVRTPDAVRGRLSRYQRGLRVGRHARLASDEQPAWADSLQRPSQYGSFEENEQ